MLWFIYRIFILKVCMKEIKKMLRFFILLTILSIFSYALVFILSYSSLFSSVSYIFNDAFTYKLQYQNNLHDNSVVIVKIDDNTLDSLWENDLWVLSFDKWTYADILDRLFLDYNVGVVGVDIVFANNSVLWVEDEKKLADAFSRYQDRVVIWSRSDYTPHPLCLYNNVQHGIIQVEESQKIRSFVPFFSDYSASEYCWDEDIPAENMNGISIFSLEIFKKYLNTLSPLQKNIGEKYIDIFLNIYEEEWKNYIQYFHGWDAYEWTLWYESYSFSDILRGKTTDDTGKKIDLEWKIVFIGEVWTLMHDSHFTPAYPNQEMPGVEVHANIYSTLSTWAFLRWGNVFLSICLFFILNIFLLSLVFYARIIYGIFTYIIVSLVVVILGAWMFYLWEIYNIFQIILSLWISYFIAYMYRFQITDKSKRELKKNFSLYVSPDVVHQITQDPKWVSTVWEKRLMSIFFSDIESFTNISESMKPENLLELLNEYFSEMTGILLKNKWTLDKYIWDSIMWFFNAPVYQENHSYFACMTAIEQQEKLKELNIIWKEKGYPHIAIRIGIHTGEAIHGNIGSMDTRLNYTVIGDSVNLASRLEAIGKYYGIYSCVSHDVYLLQKESFLFRELDMITVKWKNVPVKIYELICQRDDDEKTQESWDIISQYALALESYYANDYTSAKDMFSKIAWDKASRVMSERCQDVLDGKIEINQGVFNMTQK